MEKFDVFLWANEVEEIKNNVSVELFLFNKNYTPFKVRYSDELTNAVKKMFMLEAVEFVVKEAEKGLECREYEKADGEKNVIYRTELEKVVRAKTLIELIEKEYKDIAYFTDDEYEFKKVKGIIAKFTYPGGEAGTKTFYIAKAIAGSSALKGKVKGGKEVLSWELNGESFAPFSAEVAIKMPADNQVAIVDGTVVVFNQGKFENLFQYDYKMQVLAEEKARALQEKYKLSLAEGLTLDALLADKKAILKKVQGFDLENEMSQEQLLDYAGEMQLDLMADDDGSIIVMDSKDLATFVNLVSEDYYVSPVNGRRYLVKSKKLMDEPEGEAPRGMEA